MQVGHLADAATALEAWPYIPGSLVLSKEKVKEQKAEGQGRQLK
jgi:hypothetical protein